MAKEHQVIRITNLPRTRIARNVEGENGVRAYRESPESVLVQFRAVVSTNSADTRIMNASLSFSEARAFAAAILAACGTPDDIIGDGRPDWEN